MAKQVQTTSKKQESSGLPGIVGVFMSLLIAVMVFSGYKVFTIEKGYHDAKVSYDAVAAEYTSLGATAKPLNTEKEAININREGTDITLAKHVDFSRLINEVNKDIVAWTYCPDTVIDYPVVQGSDNEHYLHYNINGHESSSGTIFLESRVRCDFSDHNNVLHGHHMKSGAMFASLDKWQNQSYYDAHPQFYLSTIYGGDFIGEVVAAFNTVDDSIIYRFAFANDWDFQEWIDLVWELNKIQPKTAFNSFDRFVTLSTCAYDQPDGSGRSVLILKLVPANITDVMENSSMY